ncbi:class II histone deacetylase [Pseudomonas denitrificans (nom. rej.)]|uniref:Class II histone deacetylase n=1 Tax=Pseudomonas denitrificans TaxID=43306 RepID=A0A9X7N1I5_PSEDE|nr:class II histone deacetylase [Pseudomonas denitrificans (nom. rej.)]QEY73423.1 class II histone deacetylase [Pseudomonas denitrificans (nom. rej.)]
MTTAFVWHEHYMWHDTGNYAGLFTPGLGVQPGLHFENAETKRRLKNLLDVSGLGERLLAVKPLAATEEQLLRVHTPGYLAHLQEFSAGRGGDAGDNTPFGHGSYDIARLSAGGVIQAVKHVLRGDARNAYALVRPPGHHAEADRGRGFCLLANAALAAHVAMAEHGLERIAVVDWDVHHGNGSQSIFWEDPRVLTLSLHQEGNYPQDSGFVDEQGAGAGRGFNLNVPLPPGCGEGAYLHAFDEIVLPALRAHRPQLILVPCGFDAGAHDPLGRMMLHGDAYRALTARLMALADQLCDGRLVLCHEGGYEPNSVPYFGLAVIETLSGIATDIQDPHLEAMRALSGQPLAAHQRQWIANLRARYDSPLLPASRQKVEA